MHAPFMPFRHHANILGFHGELTWHTKSRMVCWSVGVAGVASLHAGYYALRFAAWHHHSVDACVVIEYGARPTQMRTRLNLGF